MEYTYNFALYPEQYQPNGHINFAQELQEFEPVNFANRFEIDAAFSFIHRHLDKQATKIAELQILANCLQSENKELKTTIANLQKEIEEINLRPPGIGGKEYEAAKARFEAAQK